MYGIDKQTRLLNIVCEKIRKPVSDFGKGAYLAYSGILFEDQDTLWALHLIFKTGVENLRQRSMGKSKCLKIGFTMIWRKTMTMIVIFVL